MSLTKKLRIPFKFTMTLKKNDMPIKSQTGYLMLDKDGVASVDYSNPEARRKLREQIAFFANVKVSKS